MTLALAWVRAVDNTRELLMASDSRLRFGCAWDCGPKVLLLPRSDVAICFAGDTSYAYPLMLQLSSAIGNYGKSRTRALDVYDLKGHALRVFNEMRGQISDLPKGQNGLGRFMSPDLLGGHQEDPQTLNRFSYVRNSPLSLTDPTGLDFNLSCMQTKDNASTCQGGVQGTTDKDGNFTATVISNDKNGNLVDQNGNQYNATVAGAGVSFSQVGSDQSSTGVFVNGSNATTVQGSGDLSGFSFTFTYSNPASGVNAGGTFTYNGTGEQAESALAKAGFQHYFWDAFDPLHPSRSTYNAVDFRTAGATGTGAASGHVTVHEAWLVIEHGIAVPLTATTPTTGTVHLGEYNPYNGGFSEHTKEVINYLLGSSH